MQKAGGSSGYVEGVDRAVVLSVLGVLALGAWGYLFYQDWAMRHMDVVRMAMPSVHAWGAADLVLVLVMWAAMMAAMMLPSVAPMVILYTRISAWRNPPARALPYAWIFLSGYLAVWAGFSVLATLLQ